MCPHEAGQNAVDEFHHLGGLVLAGDLHRLADGHTVGDIRHIQDLIHGHPHDGRGHQRDALETPALCVPGDVVVQLRRMVRHTRHQTADILRLLGVGGIGVQPALRRQLRKALRRQPPVQKLPHREVRKIPFIRQMGGDLPCRVACHTRFVLFSRILCLLSRS